MGINPLPKKIMSSAKKGPSFLYLATIRITNRILSICLNVNLELAYFFELQLVSLGSCLGQHTPSTTPLADKSSIANPLISEIQRGNVLLKETLNK